MVNLRVLRELEPILEEQRANGVEVRRARETESQAIADWVRENINLNWGVICEAALEQTPLNCFVAYQMDPTDESADLIPKNILGFACYDVVTDGVFGPSGVREDQQNTEVGTALLLYCLHEMAAEERLEAVIGWSGMAIGLSV